MSTAQVPKDPQELRAEIEQTRAELGATVEALAAKTDVKARAKEAAADATERAKAAAAEKAEHAKAAAVRAKDTAQHIAVDKVGPALAPAKERALALNETLARNDRSRVLPIAAAALATAGVIVLMARRRR